MIVVACELFLLYFTQSLQFLIPHHSLSPQTYTHISYTATPGPARWCLQGAYSSVQKLLSVVSSLGRQ